MTLPDSELIRCLPKASRSICGYAQLNCLSVCNQRSRSEELHASKSKVPSAIVRSQPVSDPFFLPTRKIVRAPCDKTIHPSGTGLCFPQRRQSNFGVENLASPNQNEKRAVGCKCCLTQKTEPLTRASGISTPTAFRESPCAASTSTPIAVLVLLAGAIAR